MYRVWSFASELVADVHYRHTGILKSDPFDPLLGLKSKDSLHILEKARALFLPPGIGSLVNRNPELLVAINQLEQHGFLRIHYFTNSINLPKLFTTSYLTFSGAYFRLISSKNFRAHSILVSSSFVSCIVDIDPLVSATK